MACSSIDGIKVGRDTLKFSCGPSSEGLGVGITLSTYTFIRCKESVPFPFAHNKIHIVNVVQITFVYHKDISPMNAMILLHIAILHLTFTLEYVVTYTFKMAVCFCPRYPLWVGIFYLLWRCTARPRVERHWISLRMIINCKLELPHMRVKDILISFKLTSFLKSYKYTTWTSSTFIINPI